MSRTRQRLRSGDHRAQRQRRAGDLTPRLFGGTFNCVKITFDPPKRQAALSERGLDFTDASIVFAGPTITVQDTRRDYGEVRFQTVGYLANRMVMVVWTPRGEAPACHIDEKVQ